MNTVNNSISNTLNYSLLTQVSHLPPEAKKKAPVMRIPSIIMYEIEVLYQLCEVAVGVNSNDESPTPNSKVAGSAKSFDNIRRWFQDHPTFEGRNTACLQQGMFNTAPLHLLCQDKNMPFDIIKMVIESAPEVGSWEDANGWIPLHYACAKGLSIEILEALLAIFPEGQRAQDHKLRTPLHFALYNKVDTESISVNGNDDGDIDSVENSITTNDSQSNYVVEILGLLESAVKIPDEQNRLPIHFAAAYGTCTAALEALIESYPESLYSKDKNGRNPLHYVMANAHSSTSPSVLKLLLSKMDEAGMNASDDDGNLPLQVLGIRASSMEFNGSIGEEKDSQRNTTKCLKIYLDAKPKKSADFITTLQSLPQWVHDDAVVHPHVKAILNRKISNRFPTSILILDGYFYMLIIGCFSIATQAHIKYCFQEETNLPPNMDLIITLCFIGATYFFQREVAQIISTISLGTFRSWIFNAENWLDLVAVVLLYYYCLAMRQREKELEIIQDFGSEDDRQFRVGAAITFGVLWAATVSYLKSTLLEFSLFFETVLYVTRKIFVYLIVLA
jgi:ankyrin repeat protein